MHKSQYTITRRAQQQIKEKNRNTSANPVYSILLYFESGADGRIRPHTPFSFLSQNTRLEHNAQTESTMHKKHKSSTNKSTQTGTQHKPRLLLSFESGADGRIRGGRADPLAAIHHFYCNCKAHGRINHNAKKKVQSMHKRKKSTNKSTQEHITTPSIIYHLLNPGGRGGRIRPTSSCIIFILITERTNKAHTHKTQSTSIRTKHNIWYAPNVHFPIFNTPDIMRTKHSVKITNTKHKHSPNWQPKHSLQAPLPPRFKFFLDELTQGVWKV